MRNAIAHIFRIWSAILLISSAFGQTRPVPAWEQATLQELRQLQEAALRDDYAYGQLAHLTDQIGPRSVGSLQLAAAINYVGDAMRQLGLDVRLEKVRVPRWVRGDERCELIAYPGQVQGTVQKIAVTALGASRIATPRDGITAEALVVSSFAELASLPRERVRGKIVLFNRRFDRAMAEAGFALDAYDETVEYRNGGRGAAEKLGAVAVLVRSVGGAAFRLTHAGATDYFNTAYIPAAAVSTEDADLIARLSAQGSVRIRLLLTSQMQAEVDSYNLIADLKGHLRPQQVVIVSGHLDSWDLGTGALDDGAGVAMAMATAHLVQRFHLQPRRTLRIVAWTGEEVGLLGARAYGKEHAGEMSSHFAAIEIDSGAGHPLGLYTVGDPSLPRLLQPVAEILQSSGAGLARSIESASPDLIPLHFRGVPAFSPLQDMRTYFDYHHTAADTLDKVDEQYLRENVAVISVLAYALTTMVGDLPRQSLALPDWLK